MSKVITFSRVFPSYHPKAGQPTYFVEKICKSLHIKGNRFDINDSIFDEGIYNLIDPKNHTIRAGHHVKPGDFIRPSVWSGKPYASKQIIIGPDIEIKKTWDFDKDLLGGEFRLNGLELHPAQLEVIAKNDGLTLGELMSWFKKPFTGQIICWSKNVEY